MNDQVEYYVNINITLHNNACVNMYIFFYSNRVEPTYQLVLCGFFFLSLPNLQVNFDFFASFLYDIKGKRIPQYELQNYPCQKMSYFHYVNQLLQFYEELELNHCISGFFDLLDQCLKELQLIQLRIRVGRQGLMIIEKSS